MCIFGGSDKTGNASGIWDLRHSDCNSLSFREEFFCEEKRNFELHCVSIPVSVAVYLFVPVMDCAQYSLCSNAYIDSFLMHYM